MRTVRLELLAGVAAIAIGLLLPLSLHADPADGSPPPGRGDLFDQIDTNHDGFISHDEHFIRAVGNKVIEVESGRVVVYPCNYDDYLYMKMKKAEADSPFAVLTRGVRPRDEGSADGKAGNDRKPGRKTSSVA